MFNGLFEGDFMAESQLREAFELMKNGENNQAMMIVRGVLRQDRENVDAWWLMANLLEDEENILKSLNQVLELNSEHRGARQKLTALRPDLAENLAPMPHDTAAKKKQDDAYWYKLDNPPKKWKTQKADNPDHQALKSVLKVFLDVLFILFRWLPWR